MKIAVISPTHHSGVTTATLLISYAIAATQNSGVCLTYTGQNKDIKSYIGVDEQEDITRSISQVVRLLEAEAISKENISEYCIKVSRNLELIDSANDSITAEESDSLLSFVYSNLVKDVVICDISSELYEESTQEILRACDVAIMVINASNNSMDSAKNWLTSELWPKSKPTMLLVNKYDPEVIAISELAKRAGVKVRDTCKIRYNSLITKNCNKQTLDTVVPFIIAKDPQVIELNVDLKECVQFIFSHMNLKIKWEG